MSTHPDTPSVVPTVDPFERCDAPMTARYRQEADASCGQRAYVATAYVGGRTLAWCLHYFDAFAERSGAPIVADSRPLLR